MRLPYRFAACLALLALQALPAAAQDLSWSAFGTVGYAVSDRDYDYQGSIDDRGTFNRDSVLGLQGDLRFDPKWSATVQLKAAQSLKSDDRWDVTPAWAFLAWRASDDLLIRAGKMRVPFYLYSESMDVGVTYDMARLPVEMYSLAPSTDFVGLYGTQTWSRGDTELALDVFGGQIGTTARFWTRDGAPPAVEPGAQFIHVDVQTEGLALALKTPRSTWRMGAYRTATWQTDGAAVPVTYPYVSIAPGLGYFQVDPSLPGPGVPSVSRIHNDILTLGVEQRFATTWRVAAEYARMIQHDTQFASDLHAGYVAAFDEIGRFTPYASASLLQSSAGTRAWYRQLTQNTLPDVVPGATQVNQAQRLAAENIWAADQRSFAVGSSYALDSRQKFKVEWLRTWVGEMTRLIDTPPGQPTPHDTHVDVWSISYSFTF
ncbi:MAG TPA: hypothetical protein VMU33_00335 [Burkholderiaceae bacterium]|nr:hypothetical protein [Burkholderiaceae bacterium]